ncbi:MAG: hypothetical protein A2Z83_08705 [Omnitrophica bacterium GWA2_52_8]|nr:MAG: hypothetical protein A2Z83_08705 [Omnitrophica bacterium GWA2_52_8]
MKHGQKGFTLTELMVSMSIFLVVVGAAVFVLTQSHQMSVDSRQKFLALNAAKSTLEVIKDTPVQQIDTIDPAGFVPVELTNGAIQIITNPFPVGNAPLATITVNVTWTGSRNMPQQLNVTTMRSRF